MKEESDSPSVPYNFSRCFNDQCPQALKCLRYIAAQTKQPITFISPSLIRHVILRMETNANVSRLLSKFMWHGDLNSCLTEFLMRMRSVSEYNW